MKKFEKSCKLLNAIKGNSLLFLSSRCLLGAAIVIIACLRIKET
jgi:hypothetical protein